MGLDRRAVRILIAGAGGVIGVRLIPLLAAEGHVVAGMARSAGKAGLMRELGALPVVRDVFDAGALTQALTAFGPEVVFHQLTDLPDDAIGFIIAKPSSCSCGSCLRMSRIACVNVSVTVTAYALSPA